MEIVKKGHFLPDFLEIHSSTKQEHFLRPCEGLLKSGKSVNYFNILKQNENQAINNSLKYFSLFHQKLNGN